MGKFSSTSGSQAEPGGYVRRKAILPISTVHRSTRLCNRLYMLPRGKVEKNEHLASPYTQNPTFYLGDGTFGG